MGKIGNVRARFVNYKKPGIFFISVNKAKGIPDFSSIVTNRDPENPIVYVRTSPLGKIIQNGIKNFYNYCIKSDARKKIETQRYIIMPDHIHFVLIIKEELDKELDYYIETWKEELTKEYTGIKDGNPTSLFEKGFNDLFFKNKVKWERINHYIQRNPYWLWMRWEKPEFFRRVHDTVICGYKCSLYGNLSLLENPVKLPVIVHRRDYENPEVINRKYHYWEYGMLNGGVIVGGFGNKAEKQIRDRAINNDCKVILLNIERYDDREKPSEGLLERCAKGNLLIITLDFDLMPDEGGDFRAKCLLRNDLAQRICGIRI